MGVLAFADDLTLLADSDAEMEAILRICERFFDQRGLAVNVKKCMSLRMIPVKNKHILKCTTQNHRYWKGRPLPAMSYKDLGKYLGVMLNPAGEVVIDEQDWLRQLNNLSSSKLKPYQKVEVLRETVIGKMVYSFRLADLPHSKLAKWDRVLRKYYRRWLHLPSFTPTAWIHSSTGGKLPSLAEILVTSKAKGVHGLLNNEDDVAVEAGLECTPYIERLKTTARVGGLIYTEMKDHFMAVKRTRLRHGPNGQALLTMANSSRSRKWLWDGSLYGNRFMTSLKLLSGVLPTKLNLTRGIRKEIRDTYCRYGCRVSETDLHILSDCPRVKGLRIERHDKIVESMAIYLRRIGNYVTTERTFVHRGITGQRIKLKPDLVIITPSGEVHIGDVAVPYEQSTLYMNKLLSKKQKKYKGLLLSWRDRFETTFPAFFQSRNAGGTGMGTTAISKLRCGRTFGFIIGSTGTITEEGLYQFDKIGLNRTQVDTTAKLACSGSAKLASVFLSTDRLIGTA